MEIYSAKKATSVSNIALSKLLADFEYDTIKVISSGIEEECKKGLKTYFLSYDKLKGTRVGEYNRKKLKTSIKSISDYFKLLQGFKVSSGINTDEFLGYKHIWFIVSWR